MSLDIITHPDLRPLRHGFFGRQGGASSGVFSGLNCGYGSTDQHEAVAINRARVAEALDVGPGALIGVHQVHSTDVVTVTGPMTARPPHICRALEMISVLRWAPQGIEPKPR